MKQLYAPNPDRNMRVVVLFSGSASSLDFLLHHDSNFNVKYEFAGAFTNDRNASGIELASQNEIPLEVHDFREFIDKRGAGFKDIAARENYFEEVAELLQSWHPDILMLSGFMLITPSSFLESFSHKVLNVHPADLSIHNDSGRRKYVGLHVVEKAIEAGETETRSTVHIVTTGVDEGPIIALSEPLEVVGDRTAFEHQELMKTACDGPAYREALDLIANGKVWINEEMLKVSFK